MVAATITEIATGDARIRSFRSTPAKRPPEVDCYVVLTDRLAVVVDTFATPEEATKMMELVDSSLPCRTLVVVNTHRHYDHVWGNSVFAGDGRWPAPILAHREAKALASGPGEFTRLHAMQSENDRFASASVVEASVYLDGVTVLDGGNMTLELLPAPGHAPDQMVLWIPDERVLLAADALESPWPEIDTAPGALATMRSTLNELSSLQPEVVLPCHGGRHGPELIEANRRYLDSLDDSPSYEEALALVNVDPTSVADPDFYQGFHEANLAATLR